MVTIVLSDFKLRKNYTYYFQEIKMTTSITRAVCQANFLNAKLSRHVKVQTRIVSLELMADLWRTGKLLFHTTNGCKDYNKKRSGKIIKTKKH